MDAEQVFVGCNGRQPLPGLVQLPAFLVYLVQLQSPRIKVLRKFLKSSNITCTLAHVSHGLNEGATEGFQVAFAFLAVDMDFERILKIAVHGGGSWKQ